MTTTKTMTSKTRETSPQTKPLTKTELIAKIAEAVGAAKNDVKQVLETLNAVVLDDLKAYGKAVIPGLVNLTVKVKPATVESTKTNPFTKEPMTVKAKPERRVLKAAPVKAFKDAVS